MNTMCLADFERRIRSKSRIGFADTRRLQRDILPDGIRCRDEAALLIALDRAVARADRTWSDWLTAAIVDFVVWGERPTGHVEAATAAWLADILGGDRATANGRRIAREVAREAHALAAPLLAAPLDAAAEPAAGEPCGALSCAAAA